VPTHGMAVCSARFLTVAVRTSHRAAYISFRHFAHRVGRTDAPRANLQPMRRIHLGGSHRGEAILTERQREVLKLIAAGKTNAEIGEALGISLDGAKWHVTEILTRLQVQTREEAANWWRHEQSVQQRASRLFGMFRPMTALGGIVLGGTVLAAVGVGAVVMLMRPGDAPASARVTVQALSPSVVPTVAPTPTASPSTLVADGPVAFTVCSQQTNYRKLTVAEMQDVFTNKRFGDGVKPGPVDWAMYISDYYWIGEPQASSLNVENFALSKGTSVGGTPSAAALQGSCATPDARANQNYEALWLYDHEVVSMRSSGGDLVVGVASKPGTYEEVEFPSPALPRAVPVDKNAASLFSRVEIVDSSPHVGTGHILASLDATGNRWEYSDRGSFVQGLLRVTQSRGKLNLRVAVDLELVCSALSGAPTAVTFAPEGGTPITVSAAVCSAPWQVAATVHLDPGDWTVTLDGDAYYTVLPKDGPRP